MEDRVDADPAAIITSSPVIDNGIVYVGVSSKAETLISATFRGSVVALDARTGKLLWKTYTVPVGYTGGAVWASTPAIDHKTGLLYVAVGNNYTTPPVGREKADEAVASELDLSTTPARWMISAPSQRLAC